MVHKSAGSELIPGEISCKYSSTSRFSMDSVSTVVVYSPPPGDERRVANSNVSTPSCTRCVAAGTEQGLPKS